VLSQCAILSTHKNLFNESKRANFSAIMGDQEAHSVHCTEPLKVKKQLDTFLMLNNPKFVLYQWCLRINNNIKWSVSNIGQHPSQRSLINIVNWLCKGFGKKNCLCEMKIMYERLIKLFWVLSHFANVPFCQRTKNFLTKVKEKISVP